MTEVLQEAPERSGLKIAVVWAVVLLAIFLLVVAARSFGFDFEAHRPMRAILSVLMPILGAGALANFYRLDRGALTRLGG